MKKLIKVSFLCLAFAVLISIFANGSFAAKKESTDPADSYVKQNAPFEDSSVKLWFEHSFKKVFTSDITPSGMDTYSVYMAKNEIENAQFVLYSDETKAGMTASVTDFTNDKGDTIPAEIYYEMYITTFDVDTTSVIGASEENTIIREGETPDPIAPLKNVSGGVFQLNGGKSQAFLIRITSDETTPSGWYSAQLEVKNSSGGVVKTATVYCYVWDFIISEETALKTGFVTMNTDAYGGSYQGFYDYLLENRLVAMDPPGGLTPTNPYLTNPRVNAIRVTYGGGGSSGSYGDSHRDAIFSNYLDIYNELSISDIWDEVKDKFYFYTADEPVGAVFNKLTGSNNMTVDEVNAAYKKLENYWPDAKSTVPFHENHPYPYFHYITPLSNYKDYELTDATQAMMDAGSISIWCPQVYAFTPRSELIAAGYDGVSSAPIREMSASISGLYSFGSDNSPTGTVGKDFFYGVGYYDWSGLYGEFEDRIKSEMALAKENGSAANSELWTYCAGNSGAYTYANHLIESTGLQTKMLFWQCYQNDVSGYLYYAANSWSECDAKNGNYADKTVTGSKTNSNWKTNLYYFNDIAFHGNGVLFYGNTQGKIQGQSCIGTIRVELMRDGIEEYQMLKMLEDYVGEKEAKAVVSRVSNNVVDYLSLPNFDDSAFDASMDEYDIMAMVRRELGNSVEEASAKGQCTHSFDDGEVLENASCIEMGTLRRTCTKCAATTDEVIPALHAVGECFKKVSGSAATCTLSGNEILECTLCGYQKTVTTPAHHENAERYSYTSRNDSMHNIICTVCSETIETGAHVWFEKNTASCTEEGEHIQYCRHCGHTKVLSKTEARGHYLKEAYIAPTCTEAGVDGKVCTRCDYTEGTEIKALGHSYTSDNICTVCGEEKIIPEYILGDLDGDGQIVAKDLNIIKKSIGGQTSLSEKQNLAADVNKDGTVTAVDMNRILRYIAGLIMEL